MSRSNLRQIKRWRLESRIDPGTVAQPSVENVLPMLDKAERTKNIISNNILDLANKISELREIFEEMGIEAVKALNEQDQAIEFLYDEALMKHAALMHIAEYGGTDAEQALSEIKEIARRAIGDEV